MDQGDLGLVEVHRRHLLPNRVLDLDDDLRQEGQNLWIKPIELIKDKPGACRCNTFEEAEYTVVLDLTRRVLHIALFG